MKFSLHEQSPIHLEGIIFKQRLPSSMPDLLTPNLFIRRTVALDKLKRIGVTDEGTNSISKLPLERLREIHGASQPFDGSDIFGSVYFLRKVAKSPVTFEDATDPSYQVPVSPGTQLFEFHFTPFGVDQRLPGFTNEAKYLGNIDLSRAIVTLRVDQDIPPVIYGHPLSREQARADVKHWGMHLHAAVLTSSFDEHNETVYRGKDAVDFLAGKIIPKDYKLSFITFAETKNLFTDSMITTLQEKNTKLIDKINRIFFFPDEETPERGIRLLGIEFNYAQLERQRAEERIPIITHTRLEDSVSRRSRNKKEGNRKRMQKQSRRDNRK